MHPDCTRGAVYCLKGRWLCQQHAQEAVSHAADVADPATIEDNVLHTLGVMGEQRNRPNMVRAIDGITVRLYRPLDI